jgi:hypothetical protein
MTPKPKTYEITIVFDHHGGTIVDHREIKTNENIMITAKEAAVQSTAEATEELKAIEVIIKAAIDCKKRSCYVYNISQAAMSALLELGYNVRAYVGSNRYFEVEW